MSAATISLTQTAIMETINRAVIKYAKYSARILRASDILMAGGVKRLAEGVYSVRSQAAGWYRVTFDRCSCQSFQFDGRGCKHQWAAHLYEVAVTREVVLAERAARAVPNPDQWAPEDAKRLMFARWLVAQGKMGEG